MAPTSGGVWGMGTEVGAVLSCRREHGPEFIKAPIFNNLILIKKTSTGSDCEFLAGLNDSVDGFNQGLIHSRRATEVRSPCPQQVDCRG